MKAWLATLGRLIVARSKTIWGALTIVLGVAVEHSAELQSLLSSVGARPWMVQAVGLALVVYGRVAVEQRTVRV